MRVLVTGGSASGKSAFAERVACALPGPHVYVATMLSYGDEGARRVRRHREARAGKGFHTVERFSDYAGLVLEGSRDPITGRVLEGATSGTVLLECLGNVVTNELFGTEVSGDDDGLAARDAESVLARVLAGVDALASQCANLVVVTNEVGSDGVPYPEETMAFVRVLGRASCELARTFDEVWEVACGVPARLKGEGGHAWAL